MITLLCTNKMVVPVDGISDGFGGCRLVFTKFYCGWLANGFGEHLMDKITPCNNMKDFCNSVDR
jgi:hypothetical protein